MNLELKKSGLDIVIIGIISIIIICGCDEQYYGITDHKSTITVNAFFSPQDTIRMNLSYSEDPYSWEKDSFINNAEIYLELPDLSVKKVIRDTYKYRYRKIPFPGLYKLPEIISYQPGEYRLTVQVPGYQTVTAIDSIPELVKIKNCSFYPDTVGNDTYFLLSFKDPIEIDNHYAVSLNLYNYYTQWKSNIDSADGGYSIPRYGVSYNAMIKSDDSFVDAVIYGSIPQIIFSDKSFSASTEETVLRIDYMDAYLRNFSESTDSLIFEIQLHSISKTYYNYAIDYYKQNMAEKEFYTDPVTVHSNIDGGYGIFAGYNTSSTKIVYKMK